MRRMGLIVAFLLGYVMLMGQQNQQVTKDQLALFTKSTTYVVWDNNPMSAYNIAIKAAVEKYWKITPFKYITVNEFDKFRMDPANSFIIMTKVFLTKDKREAEYQYLNVLMGNKAYGINDMPEILTMPLHYTGVDESTYTYKLGVIVRFAQDHVKAMIESPKITQFRNLKYYNSNAKDVKKKTLLLLQEDMAEEVNTIEKVKAAYPFECKFVTPEEIETAVLEQTPNTLVLHQISPGPQDNLGRSYKMIFGVDDNKLYYYRFETISEKRPAGMLLRDFKRITAD